MKLHATPCLLGLTSLLFLDGVSAKVAMPKWFGDHMVLQTDEDGGPLSTLYGKAIPGEVVQVNIITDVTSTLEATADSNGEWKVQLNPASSYHTKGESFTIEVTSKDDDHTLTAKDVKFGDVFLCGGQSNMVYPVRFAFNPEQEAETLKDFPNFRFFVTERAIADQPHWDLPTGGECDNGGHCQHWITQEQALENDSLVLLDFSAVCYMTVRDLAKLQSSIGSTRPVGLIQMARKGSRVESWMSQEALAGTSYSDQIPPPRNAQAQNEVSVLYNAMAHPWRHYAVRAVLWYQGEANANQRVKGIDQTDYYATMCKAMIADWRKVKGIGDFTWGTVQLAPSEESGSDPTLPTGRVEVRIAQAQTMASTSNSAMAVTLDLGGRGQWGYDHPPNKSDVAHRLALGVLHAAFGKQTPVWTGPVFNKVDSSDGKIVLQFDEVGSAGMKLTDVKADNIKDTMGSNDCQLCCAKAPPFEVKQEGGSGWTTIPRDAISIQDSSVIFDLLAASLSSTAKVAAVRYAWTDYVECVLENSDGLLASPFLRQTSNPGSSDSLRNRNRRA